MSCLGGKAVMADEELLDFLLQEDEPPGDLLGNGADLLEGWGLPEVLDDKEVEDFLSSLLSPFAEEPSPPLSYSPPDSDSGISEDQTPFPGGWTASPSSSPKLHGLGSPSCSDIIQSDHNYVLPQDSGGLPGASLESVRAETAEGDVSIDLDTWEAPDSATETEFSEESCSVPVTLLMEDFMSGTSTQFDFPEMSLTEEEKRLLEKEGVSLPSHLPLTKAEERILKRVRRKIRNKQSAQDSRRRKKVYVDGLESRVVACTAQNTELQKKVQLLQRQNMSLLEQLRKLQALVKQSSTKTTTASTCVLVLLLSFCLILSPSIYPFGARGRQQEFRGVLSRQLREFPSDGVVDAQVLPVQLAEEVEEQVMLSKEMLDPDSALPPGNLNRSLDRDRSLPPKADSASTISTNSSADPPAGPGSGLGPPPAEQQLPPGPGSVPPLPPSALAKKQLWVERTASVVLQPRHSDEM
uniref:cAMP responsive element binding protein 3 n=1 Tax=Sphenodon punctatus TaxID=8508 RepID=A0A8D0HDL0_SPHPU